MKLKDVDWWELIIWTSITILFLWLLAKSVGLINTPIIIEVIPYVTGFITVLGIGKKLGKYTLKLDNVINDIRDMRIELKEIKNDIHNLDRRVTFIESRV
jgi:hypothetical protein